MIIEETVSVNWPSEPRPADRSNAKVGGVTYL